MPLVCKVASTYYGERHDDRSGSKMKHQPLTPREREVLQFVWEGFSTREIANKLGRSYNTIAMYRQQIRSKFGVTTTAAALKIALREGILVEKK